ncbi:MAG: GntR family transcriptional regulator [Candidatus Methylomirabilales bacterium]
MPDGSLPPLLSSRPSGAGLDGPLAFRTLPEQIAARIRQAILTGRLAPGSRLVEMTIAAQMRTSRGPVRDALALLEREGLVARLPHRGACVQGFSERTLREAASLRAVLEDFAVTLALPRLEASHLAELDTLVRGMEAAARRRARAEFNELDYRFHERILEVSGHATLHTIWRGMQQRVRAFLASTNLANPDLRAVARHHRDILQGLAARRLSGTRRAVRAHFARVEEELNFLLDGGQRARRRRTASRQRGERAAARRPRMSP